MEKKNIRKIEASAAIFAVVAILLILSTGPSIVADQDPGSPYHDQVIVTLTADDTQSLVTYINYSITCSNPNYQYQGWQQYVNPGNNDPCSFSFELYILGNYTVQYYAVDTFGNVETLKETTFSLIPSDQTPPTTTISITDAIPT